MPRITCIFATAALLWLALSAYQRAAASVDDDDGTPVPICTNMPDQTVISAIQRTDAVRVCNAMNSLLGVRVKDVRAFSKSAVALSLAGYDGTFEQTTRQLVEIVRLRGLQSSPDRWSDNLEIVVRAYQAFNGLLTPQDALDFLRSAGGMSRTLSDHGFMVKLIVIKQHKAGER